MLSLLYGAYAEKLRSNITPYLHRNTTATLPQYHRNTPECVVNAL